MSLTAPAREAADPAIRSPSAFAKAVLTRPGLAYAIAGAALFLLLALYFAAALGRAMVDDAYIALIYARNLASAAGLVYTDGVRVEGYTDFVWVLIGAGAFAAGVEPVIVYRVVGIGAGLALLAAVWMWNERFTPAPPHARIAPLLLAAMGPLAYWAVAGLEQTAFTSLVFIATLTAVAGGRHAVLAGPLFCIAAMSRPDAVVMLAPVVVFVYLRGRETGERGNSCACYWASRCRSAPTGWLAGSTSATSCPTRSTPRRALLCITSSVPSSTCTALRRW